MTAEKFRKFSDDANLCCISQECLNWTGNKLIDCISVVTPKGSIWERHNRVFENKKFTGEVSNLKRMAELYGDSSFKLNNM
jgi:hypothetical protein